LTELLDSENSLDLCADNNTPVPFDGFVEPTFDLANVIGGDILIVPFLVSNTIMTKGGSLLDDFCGDCLITSQLHMRSRNQNRQRDRQTLDEKFLGNRS